MQQIDRRTFYQLLALDLVGIMNALKLTIIQYTIFIFFKKTLVISVIFFKITEI